MYSAVSMRGLISYYGGSGTLGAVPLRWDIAVRLVLVVQSGKSDGRGQMGGRPTSASNFWDFLSSIVSMCR